MTAPAQDEFDQPRSGGNWFKPAEHNGNLILIIKVHEVRDAYDNLKKEDVPRAEFDYVDLDDRTNLDDNGQPTLVAYAYDNHAGIVNKIKPALSTGRGVLGRIAQAPSDKGNHAWILGPYDESGTDAQRARDWLAKHKAPSQPGAARPAAPAPTAPASPAAPPAAAPVTAPAPAAPAAPAPNPAHQINGVQVDPEQYAKLVALGLVPAVS